VGDVYIVWRSRPIVGDRKAGLFVDYSYDYIRGADGRVVKGGRRRVVSLDGAPWRPMTCEHSGPGRVARTPLLVQAGRVGGKPRQRVLHRFPTLRSCCMLDELLRAAWWHDVVWETSFWDQPGGDYVPHLVAWEIRAVLAKLRKVVPPPTPAGVAAFTAFRLRREAERQAAYDAILDALRRAEGAHRREQAWGGHGPAWGPRPGEPWWEVLGLSPAATPEEVRDRYRELAKVHHPDVGGTTEDCQRLLKAYDEARLAAGRGG